MIYAINDQGFRVAPTPGQAATCPLCKARVRAKCGQIVSWHWSHISSKDCDSWSEGETPWHLGWKRIVSEVDPSLTEVSMGPHRADIRLPEGVVIELQHSTISTDDIKSREEFYGRRQMVWIFDAREAYEAGRLSIRERENYCTFRWKQARKSIAVCRADVYLDTGRSIFQIKSIKNLSPFSGWGMKLDRHGFIDDIKNQAIKGVVDSIL